jgi:hypothetical protein
VPATRIDDEAVTVTIPGGVWPAEGGTRAQDVILRPIDGEDELFVLDTAMARLPSERATALLARCLREGAPLAWALTVGDREALLLHLRRLAFGDRIECVLRCPAESCGERMEFTLDVADLLVPPYPDARQREELALDADGATFVVTFRLPNAADLDAAAVIARSDPTEGGAELFRRCVLAASRSGAAVQVDGLPESVRSAVSDRMEERDPQAAIELEVACPSCARSFSATFDTASFFLHELEDRAARVLDEIHTLAMSYHWSESEILRMPPRRRERYLERLNDRHARSA